MVEHTFLMSDVANFEKKSIKTKDKRFATAVSKDARKRKWICIVIRRLYYPYMVLHLSN